MNNQQPIRVLITGSTGMVGKGVLLQCIDSDLIREVILINRRPIDIESEKIQEIILPDFADLKTIQSKLGNLDACFHNMGVSSLGLSEEEFSLYTYEYTKLLADMCFEESPNCVFNYVSGLGTDSSEKGRVMWARVKGRTENYIIKKGFTDAYLFRPGMIIPERGIQSGVAWYNRIYQVTKPIHSWFLTFKSVTSTGAIGDAMMNSVFFPQDKKILEGADINELAKPRI